MGHTVVVYDQNAPLRELIGSRMGSGDDGQELRAAQGITRPSEAELSANRLWQAFFFSRPLARAVNLLNAVLEERREER